MRGILPLLRRERAAIALTLACAGVNQVMLLAEPQLIRLIIDRYALRAGALTTTAFFTGTGGLVALSVGLAFVARLSRNYQTYCSNLIAHRVAGRLYAAMVGQSLLLPYSRVADVGSGERLQRLQKARADVFRVLSHVTVPFSAALALFVVVLYAFTLHWSLGLAIFLLPSLLAAVLIPISQPIKRQQRAIAGEVARMSGAATEAFRNAELVTTLGVQHEEMHRLNERAARLLQLEMRGLDLDRRYRFIEGTVLNAARAIVLLLALWLLRQGSLSTGQLVTIFLYSLSMFSPLSQLGDLIANVRETMDSLDAAGGVPGQPPRPQPPDLETPPIRTLALENVRFRYPGSTVHALDGVTLRLRAGQIVALVGPSGAGKSSVVKLLTGLYSPEDGRIVVNGAAVDPSAGRQRIGVVSQETQLFSGTIRDNLKLVKPDATDDECLEALAAAALAPEERGRRGLDMPIGEGGARLSGGERQRVAIARALLGNPDVLIFDEATSMLDAIAESEVIDTIQRLTIGRAGGRLTLMISHRLSIAAGAHYVYVLAGGRIVDEGTHDALAARAGLYSELWRQHEAGAQAPDRLSHS